MTDRLELRDRLPKQPQSDGLIDSGRIRSGPEVRYLAVSLQYLRHGLAAIQ